MKKRTKLIGLLIFFIAICIITCCFFFHEITVTDLRDFIEGYGVWVPVVYVLALTILPAVFFPVPIFAIVAGLMFGFGEGTLFTMVGTTLNSAVMFFLAKSLAKDTLTKFLKKRLPEKWSKVFGNIDHKRGFWSILILRLIPVIPNNLINYGAGLTSIRFRSYILATILGILPGTLVFINIGDKAVDVHSLDFIIAIIILVVVAAISLFLVKKITPSQITGEKSEESQEDEDVKEDM